MTHTDFGDPEMVDFGRFRPIIVLDSAIKALLRLLELVCVSDSRGVSGWLAYSATVCRPEIVEKHGFLVTNRLKNCLQTADLMDRALVKRLKYCFGEVVATSVQ